MPTTNHRGTVIGNNHRPTPRDYQIPHEVSFAHLDKGDCPSCEETADIMQARNDRANRANETEARMGVPLRRGTSVYPVGSPLDNDFEDMMRRKSQKEGW